MPIEIKITALHELTTKQIEDLNDFLLSSRSDETVVDEVFARQAEDPAQQALKKIMNSLVSGVAVDDPHGLREPIKDEVLDDNPQPKKRKRRTKAEIEADSVALMDISTPEVFKQSDTTIQDLVADVANVEVLTAQELIMFVLENVKEKRLTFDQAIKVANGFGLVNLNALEEPTNEPLIRPIYQMLRGLIL